MFLTLLGNLCYKKTILSLLLIPSWAHAGTPQVVFLAESCNEPTYKKLVQGLALEIAMAAMDAGSEFLVAPVLVPEVVTWCAMHNIVIIPGCQTPTEAYNAYKAGAPVQKIFPGVAGGHMWVKAVSAALPMLTLNPTVRLLHASTPALANGMHRHPLSTPRSPPRMLLFPPGRHPTTTPPPHDHSSQCPPHRLALHPPSACRFVALHEPTHAHPSTLSVGRRSG